MNLKDKLYQLNSKTTQQTGVDKNPSGNGIENFITGEFQETPSGACFVSKKLFKPGDFSGKVDFFTLGTKPKNLFKYLGKDERLGDLDVRQALFLDTETTGLAGGAGTYVFLIGIGFFTDAGFQVEQYFMRDYHEEMALLHCLQERLKSAGSFITYNGKSYDVPLLKTRFTLSKLTTTDFPEIHLDLLHTSRRLWRCEMETFDLGSVEYKILGISRQNDVPGALIPQLYFDYLQTRDAAPLQGVFEHNLQDILSLAGIATRACALFGNDCPEAPSTGEQICIGRVFEDLRLYEEAVAIYEQVRVKIQNPKWKTEIDHHLTWCYKRLSRWDAASEVWKEMLSNGQKSLFPWIELAKYFEHIECDLAQAQQKVLEALNWLELQELLQAASDSAENRKALLHRLRRIRKKMEKIA